MMKVIFLGGLFPKESRNEIENKSKGVIQYAADALQWSIVDGLDKYVNDLRLINLYYIGSFPRRYVDYKIKSFKFAHKPAAKDLNVGFINLPFYKLFSRYNNSKKALNNVLINSKEVIMIYAVHTPFIKAAIDARKKNPSIKICLIVPDLPEYMGDNDNFILKFSKLIEKRLLNSYLKEIDCFVVLTDNMIHPLKIQSRPWVRMEGIFNQSEKINVVEKEFFKTILYSGTLAKRYGILNLLKAFSFIKDENYRLWICGDGDAKEILNEMREKDSRIRYFGQISREEVLELQKRATVLVNPRTSEGEFTKYSFPSKTMEYLASGTPCILYRLDGIPEEYFDYCFVSNNETPHGLFQTILFVCEKCQKQLNYFGDKAKKFILEKKTPEKQCGIIYEMLKKL